MVNLLGDLKNSRAIYLKGILFFAIVLISGAWLIVETVVWKRAVFVCLLSWSSARSYYFMFYVIEKYIDPQFKFSGIMSFIRYVTQKSPSD